MRILDLLIQLQPLLFLVIGACLPWLEKQLVKLIKTEQYQIVKKVYQSIDPEFIEQIGGQVRFVELIEESIKAAGDGKLSYAEIQHITKLVIKEFRLDKALSSK